MPSSLAVLRMAMRVMPQQSLKLPEATAKAIKEAAEVTEKCGLSPRRRWVAARAIEDATGFDAKTIPSAQRCRRGCFRLEKSSPEEQAAAERPPQTNPLLVSR